jgi:5-methylcytosine-specific restriction enzyme subunit McrC
MIPIENIYFLLVYAWDVLEESESLDVAAEDCTTLAELFALVLSRGTDRLLRRGLDRGYIAHEEVMAGIRGKLKLGESVKTGVLWQGRAVCHFDDLSHDIPANRIIASTLRRLLVRPDLDAEIHDRVAGTCYRLSQIADIPINDHVFRTVQLHRNNREYRLLMDVCRLIHRIGLTREDQGEVSFRDFVRDPRRMRRLFERFVRNFIRREVHWLKLEPLEVPWYELMGDGAALARVPRMRTDVRVSGPAHRLIIETKFVPELFQHGLGGKQTFRSSHLYQLHAYVSNLAPDSALPVGGMLLYPAVGQRHDFLFAVAGRQYRVVTLNLDQDWRGVKRDLFELLAEPATPVVAPGSFGSQDQSQ